MKQMKHQKPQVRADAAAVFVAAAKSIEADEDKKHWEARLKAVVKPSAKSAKKISKK